MDSNLLEYYAAALPGTLKRASLIGCKVPYHREVVTFCVQFLPECQYDSTSDM